MKICILQKNTYDEYSNDTIHWHLMKQTFWTLRASLAVPLKTPNTYNNPFYGFEPINGADQYPQIFKPVNFS
jgi:hypothetical protein